MTTHDDYPTHCITCCRRLRDDTGTVVYPHTIDQSEAYCRPCVIANRLRDPDGQPIPVEACRFFERVGQ